MKNTLLALFSVFLAFVLSAQPKDNPKVVVFKSGDEGYKSFRIPAIVKTRTGRLLAFAEGRVNGSSDTGNIDLVMKSSDDNGKSWSRLKVIWDDSDNVCGNPSPVVDKTTGIVYLLMSWNLGEDHESEIIAQQSRDTRHVYITSTADNGGTWANPMEITSMVKPASWTWYATGPCHGIQMSSKKFRNRLLIPCDHIDADTQKYFSHVIYSDDHGKTWNQGGTTPQDQVNECCIAELPGGKLLLNMRNYDRKSKTRKISYSDDGGNTWSDLTNDKSLIEPICQASVYYSKKAGKLFFLNPASETRRESMTLKSSKDEGKTWITEKILHKGPSAYSDLTVISKNEIGCLYEAGDENPYEGIVFETVNVKK